MGAGGCIGTQQTQNKAKIVIGGRAGHIWDNHVWGEMATRMVWSPHDRHRTFGGNGGDVRGAQVLSMHS